MGSTPIGRTILYFYIIVGKWLNLVEHLVWDQGVAGSNPVFPTSYVIYSCFSRVFIMFFHSLKIPIIYFIIGSSLKYLEKFL